VTAAADALYYQSLANTAAEAARLAGAVIATYYRQPVANADKADASPVSRADEEAETIIRAAIAARFPRHGIIGEEYGSENPDAEYVWVIDPIDGTKAFLTGKPLFGTLIAVLQGGRPVVGVLYQPVLQELWLGVEGVPSTLNGRPLATSQRGTLAQAVLATTSPTLFTPPQRTSFEAAARQVRFTEYGGDCYNYGLLAAGTVDLVIEHNLKFHDCAALLPIIAGAGGVVTGWDGRALTAAGFDGSVLAAANPALHGLAQAVLAGGA
jgi:inositol-phosphate phosphatase/L-galactose 1-phosphate phosphatase/histidinol-phosphatase